MGLRMEDLNKNYEDRENIMKKNFESRISSLEETIEISREEERLKKGEIARLNSKKE